jgi:hypothetical protein
MTELTNKSMHRSCHHPCLEGDDFTSNPVMLAVRASDRISSYSYSVKRYSYSYSKGTLMNEPIFDHERLDVYRLAIEYVTSSYRIAKSLSGINRHARDQWLRAAQSIALNIAEGNGKQSFKDKNRFFEIARGSAL